MGRLLDFVGYNRTKLSKNRFAYIINSVNVLMILVYLTCYILFVDSPETVIITSCTLVVFLGAFYFLKNQKYTFGKILMLLGFFIQESIVVFVIFPKETNFNHFYFVVAPITFFIFDYALKEERILIIITNVIAVLLLVTSEYIDTTPFIPITTELAHFFSIISVLLAISSITFVYFLYARDLAKVYQELKMLANTDSLTNINNRRVLFNEGEILFDLCAKYNRQMTLVIFDIDHFKIINDTYGHPTGDDMLIELTELITSRIRKNDIFARYGGEEFAIILKDTYTESHLDITKKLKSTIDSHTFGMAKDLNLHITISAGVANFSDGFKDFDSMVMAADNALYKAKTTGRNKVVVHTR